MKRFFSIVVFASLFVFVGCSEDSSKDKDVEVDKKVTEAELKSCKDGCDHLKFFKCNDAQEQAACYENCGKATSSQIELFHACAMSDICDPQCSTNIKPLPDDVIPVVTGTCETGLASYIKDTCIASFDTVAACSSLTAIQKAIVVECLSKRTGCTLSSDCQALFEEFSGKEETAQEKCQDACSTMKSFNCIGSADLVKCLDICEGLSDQKAKNFSTCVDADGICKDDSCYTIINPDGAGGDVTGCKSSCKSMSLFNCIDAVEHSECNLLCEKASASSITTFKDCSVGICEDSSCLNVFRNANK